MARLYESLPRDSFIPMSKDPLIIAIDGTAASGKGTLAKRLADYLGYAYLDTGLLYRRVALTLLEQGLPAEDRKAAIEAARNLDPATLDDPALRSAAAGRGASIVAAIPEVRQALYDFQRNFPYICGKPGAILDGRDIGTVIFPEAPLKFFVDADITIRAERRHKELLAKGETILYETVLADMKIRDARDAGRPDAPMKAAEDAIQIDTTSLNADETFYAAWQALEFNGLLLLTNWSNYFNAESLALFSPSETIDNMIADILAIVPDDIWPMLEQVSIAHYNDFMRSKIHLDNDPSGLNLMAVLQMLKTRLRAAAKPLALPDVIQKSDRLAGHPGDPESYQNSGVLDEEIDIDAALQPCRQAALLYPEIPRLSFQYARVLIAAGEVEKGILFLQIAAEQGHGGALAYLGDMTLDGILGEPDPVTAKNLYRGAKESGFWLAESIEEQIEEISPDAASYHWDIDLHQDIHYHYISILVQLSNGFPSTETGLPSEHVMCYVIGSLAAIRREYPWMIDSAIIPDRKNISGTIHFVQEIGPAIEKAAAKILSSGSRGDFLDDFYNDLFTQYLDMGYEDGRLFAKTEGPDSGQLELYIQTALNLYFSQESEQRRH